MTHTFAKPLLAFDPFVYRRRSTRVVWVGRVAVGGDNPLRIQSMTTTLTSDVDASVAQVLRLAAVGCEIVRLTAPTEKDAEALGVIQRRLQEQGCGVPLVADIHFRPAAAMIAAEFVDKVRINPGNFADAKSFKVKEYSEAQYAEELERIAEKFLPLVLKLQRLGRALRIGSNHGSLSDRVLNRYGDTPLGMVESALEYVRLARRANYHDIILSMKSSNPKVMISAYRLLAKRMDDEGMDYPLHLGVTEAGDGEDGRLKSAVGMGALLEDGLGDTLRVSLTEEPEAEVPVAQKLAAPFPRSIHISTPPNPTFFPWSHPDSIARRATHKIHLGSLVLGGGEPPRVVLDAPSEPNTDRPLEGLVTPHPLKTSSAQIAKLSSPSDLTKALTWADGLLWPVSWGNPGPLQPKKILILAGEKPEPLVDLLQRMENTSQVLLSLEASPALLLRYARWLACHPRASNIPLHLHLTLSQTLDDNLLETAGVLGSLLSDGIGDSLQLSSPDGPLRQLNFLYDVLQAAGARTTKAEFVSCPSCGRTLFDLPSTTQRIKARTGHLKNVKIAIMGCIVNGPGEMADADFGYVGAGPGRINLYVGRQCVEKGIPVDLAEQKLIELIQAQGRWIDPR